jgi:hypothetical protein
LPTHLGGCHCGAVRIAFRSDKPPGAFEPRTCQCGFCRRHGSRAVSDPEGLMTIDIRRPEIVQQYRFGSRTADYLVCGACGVYVAAVMCADDGAFSVTVVNALDRRDDFDGPPAPVDFDGEDVAARLARRRVRWTPTVFGPVEE